MEIWDDVLNVKFFELLSNSHLLHVVYIYRVLYSAVGELGSTANKALRVSMSESANKLLMHGTVPFSKLLSLFCNICPNT